jgi:biotin carboxyl carrier protein
MENTKYKIIVNDTEILLDHSEVENSNIIKIDESNYHILIKNKAAKVKVLNTDFLNKNYLVEIDGEIFDIIVKDNFDQEIDKLGLGNNQLLKITNVNAPMPGLVIDIMVTAGQTIKKGENLIILEAMKMENSIKMPNDGIIGKILVKKGQAVEKGAKLFEIE